jgi:hypothetical protein
MGAPYGCSWFGQHVAEAPVKVKDSGGEERKNPGMPGLLSFLAGTFSSQAQGALAIADLEFHDDEPLVLEAAFVRVGVFFFEELFQVLGFFPEIQKFVVSQASDLFFEGKILFAGEQVGHKCS